MSRLPVRSSRLGVRILSPWSADTLALECGYSRLGVRILGQIAKTGKLRGAVALKE